MSDASHGRAFRRAAEESMHAALVPGAALVGLALASIGTVHIHVGLVPPSVAHLQIVIGATMLSVAAWLRRRRFRPAVEQAIGTAIAMPVLVSDAVFLWTATPPQHAFGLYLVALAAGSLAFERAWFTVLDLAAAGVLVFVIASSDAPFTDWSRSVMVMTGVLATSAVLHVSRSRYLAQLDALRAANERTRATRDHALERFRYMTERATDLISELGEDGRILYANPAHEALLGRHPDDLVGRYVWDLLLPSVTEAQVAAMGATLGAGERVVEVLDLAHADGTLRSFEVHIRSYAMPSGESRILAMSRDVTQQKALAHELERHRERLEAQVEERTAALATSLRELERSERLASVGTLSAGIAHQINNPIAAILSTAQLALVAGERGAKAPLHGDALRKIVHEARRCGRIVRSLLKFARNEPTEKAPEDLVALVARVCADCEGYARSRGGVIERVTGGDIEPGALVVWASAIELEQALLNLVRNGLESSPGSVHVRVGVERLGALARVTVSDDGPGIDEGAVAHVFDPFFTTRLRDGGTGLGLSVAHGVARDHGGDLRVESEPGKGTRFLLELPLLAGRAGRAAAPPSMLGALAGDRQR